MYVEYDAVLELVNKQQCEGYQDTSSVKEVTL